LWWERDAPNEVLAGIYQAIDPVFWIGNSACGWLIFPTSAGAIGHVVAVSRVLLDGMPSLRNAAEGIIRIADGHLEQKSKLPCFRASC